MLTPDYLAAMPAPLIARYDELESDIIKDISRRISKTDFKGITATADWQIAKAQQLRMSMESIQQKIAQQTGKDAAEIKKLFTDAKVETLKFDNAIYAQAGFEQMVNSKALDATLKSTIKRAQGEVTNLTRTTAKSVGKTLENALDTAYLQVQSGAFTNEQAIKQAVKECAANGLTTVAYKGMTMDLQSSVKRSLITGANQAAAQLQIDRANDLGWDLVEVTSHGGARPDHAIWQGQVYSLSGRHSKYPKLSTATGYGEVDGLCGANCRHNFYPFLEGVSDGRFQQYVTPRRVGETAEQANERSYKDSQRQRANERDIRKYKRQADGLEAAGMPNDAELAKVRQLQGKQRELLKETGRTRSYSAEGIVKSKDVGLPRPIPQPPPVVIPPVKPVVPKPEPKPKTEPKPKKFSYQGKEKQLDQPKVDWVKDTLKVSDQKATDYVESIWGFTGTASSDIRAASRGINIGDARLEKHAKDLKEFMSAAPKYEGEISRGIGFNHLDSKDPLVVAREQALYRDMTTVGSKVDMAGISSWTVNPKTAADFSTTFTNEFYSQKGVKSVVLKVEKPVGGVQVSHIGKYKSEGEVLMGADARYEVVAVKEKVITEVKKGKEYLLGHKYDEVTLRQVGVEKQAPKIEPKPKVKPKPKFGDFEPVDNDVVGIDRGYVNSRGFDKSQVDRAIKKAVDSNMSRPKPFQNKKELKAWMKDKELGYVDEVLDLDLNVWTDFVPVFDEMTAMYPEIKKTVKRLVYNGQADNIFMSAGGDHVTFTSMQKDYAFTMTKKMESIASGWSAYGDGSFRTTIRHELGHIHHQTLEREFIRDISDELVDTWKDPTVHAVSRYAGKNNREFYAETWTNLHSPAHPLSEAERALKAILEDHYGTT